MNIEKVKISDKNKLIKKHLENVDWRMYKKALGSKAKGRGIYVLYKNGKVYYIGLSKRSLRSRLRNHALRDRHKGKWDFFSFYQIRKTKYIKDVESLLLRIFRPAGNSVRGRFRRQYNLAKNSQLKKQKKVIKI